MEHNSIPFILDITAQNYYFDGTVHCGASATAGKKAYVKILIVSPFIKIYRSGHYTTAHIVIATV